ncbi:enoyl-CoA delta isomerase 2, peroxisomal-like isoform X3 [Haliotis rufescens]|uniref:enoyl-CoA delta isomerase 2, peroxisomal-like isoform X3 n=1 Tax=Haliotis rufescens TaxID=6454 RepID=UPI001EB05054|nr:enoyl-CoA delta isomerase 2, peroxisomal-like isoform X3 [Haliotis rufescens]
MSVSLMACRRLAGSSKTLHRCGNHGWNANTFPSVTHPRFWRAMSTAFSGSFLDLNFLDEGIAVVAMKRGQNTLRLKVMEEWHKALDAIEKTSECRALVTTGNEKFFSSGFDLQYMETIMDQERQLAQFVDEFNKLIVRLMLYPLPTVAAISGHAFAGGAMLALAHDLRVMRRDQGWVCLNEILIDVTFPPVLLAFIRAKLAPGPLLTQAVLQAKRYTAEEAVKCGIVDQMVDQSQLVNTAAQMANEFLGKHGIKRETLHSFKKGLYSPVLQAYSGQV